MHKRGNWYTLDLIVVSFLVTFSVLFALYFLYLPVLLLLSSIRKRKHLELNPKTSKNVSVVIATYNEESSIRKKLESLLAVAFSYGSYEIIVVDSGSIDNTRGIVTEYANKGVVLLEQEKRLGKANAINFALTRAKGDIIVMSDANSEFTPGSVNALVKKFDGETGAVLPRFMPSSKMNLWDRIFYWVHHTYKSLESRTDSVFVVFGELFAFRKDLISSIDERTAADDLEIAVTIRKRNFKIKYAPNIIVKEKLPDNRREVKTQKVRHILGILQVMTKNIDLFWNPKYGLYGLLIFPTHFLQMTIGPFLCFLVTGLFCMNIVKFAMMLLNPIFIIVLLAIVAVLFAFLYHASSKVRHVTSFFYDFFALQVYVIIAVLSLTKKRDDHVWEKISSTR